MNKTTQVEFNGYAFPNQAAADAAKAEFTQAISGGTSPANLGGRSFF